MEDMSRSNGYNTYRSSDRRDEMPERPPSDALVDLHVYLVPHNLWRERYNNFLNANVTETVSAGIIRVHPEQKVIVLRDEIDTQIGAELVPREYVFLKSVGRSITKLNAKQEYQLKVKNFIPPQSYAPELFLLEAQDVDSSRSSVRPESPEYNTGRKSDRTPYTSHNTNPTSPEYNMSSTENLTSRHPAGVKHNYPSPFHQSPIPKIPQKNNPDPRRYESMDPDSHSTPDDVINNYPRAQPYQTPPHGKRAQSPPSREDRNEITPPRRQDRGANRGHDPASGRDSDTPTDAHQPNQINTQRSQSPSRVVNPRSQSPERIVDRKSPPRYTTEKVHPQDKPNEHLARIDDDNVATPPKHSERPREIPTKKEQTKSPIREAEKPQAKQGRKVASPVPGEVRTNGISRPLSASWGSDQDTQKSASPGGAPPPKQKPQKGSVPGPPLSATPPPLVESSNRPVAAGNKYDPRLETYTNHTNEDSGIAGLTPEDHYRENQDDVQDRRKRENEEKRRREEELRNRLKADQEEREQKEKSIRDKEWERHEQLEEERRRKDEEEKRRREGEKRRQEEEDKRRENEEEARREQDRNLDRLSASDEELNRFPSPPPLKMSTPSSSKGPRDSIGGSDTERGQQGKTEKEQLMRELEQAREARKTTEKQREDLVKKAKLLQNKMQNRRNHARDLWKKRYFEEKKRTSPLEEQCNRLRHELEIIHRKLMNTLEGPAKDKATQRVGDLKPSLQVGQYRAPFDPYEQYEVTPSPTYLPRISRQLNSEFHPPMSLYTYRKDPKSRTVKKPPPSYASRYETRRYQAPTQQIFNNNQSNATPYYVNPKSALYTPSNSMSSVQSTPKESSFVTPLGSPKRILYRYDGNAYVSPSGRKRSAMASTGHSSRSSGKSVQFVERVFYI